MKPLVNIDCKLGEDFLDMEIILGARLKKWQIIVTCPFFRLLL